MMFRRARVMGNLERDGANLMIDILNEEGDIVDEVAVDRKAFEYLRRKLYFRWENREQCVHSG